VALGAAAVGQCAVGSALAAKPVHPHHHVKTPGHTGAGHLVMVEPVAPARLPARAATRERYVQLVNAHTNESLQAVYWRDGRYLPDALHQVNHVLRDHMSGDVHQMDPHLVDLLGDLRQAVGTSEPFVVISGYRSPRTNAWMHRTQSGVASNSMHVKGKASDIMLPGYELTSLHNAALALSEGGVGYYPRTGFVHVDTGKVRQWAFG